MKNSWLKGLALVDSSPSLAALNLGNRHIKGLVLKGGKIASYFIANNTDLGATIKELCAEKKISGRTVRLSLKNPSCLVRYFSFPKMDKKKLHQAIFYEMNKFIPFSPDEVYFDFSVLKENGPQLSILLAVAKKDFIDTVVEAFARNNLKLSEITLDSLCLVNLFLRNYPEASKTNVCILDIGYKFSTMTILHKGLPYLTRDVKLSARDVFQIVGRIKNINLDGIDTWLSSLKDTKEFLELARDSIASLCKEMKSSFDYFEVNAGEHIATLYLSGGLSAVKNIERPFTECLETEVKLLEALPPGGANFASTFALEEFAAVKNSFSALFGLIL